MDQTDKALALLEETVQLEPTNAIAHYRVGTLYRKKAAWTMPDAKLNKVLLIRPEEIVADVPDDK